MKRTTIKTKNETNKNEKERYRKNAKKTVISFLNKKNAADLLKEHREGKRLTRKQIKKLNRY